MRIYFFTHFKRFTINDEVIPLVKKEIPSIFLRPLCLVCKDIFVEFHAKKLSFFSLSQKRLTLREV